MTSAASRKPAAFMDISPLTRNTVIAVGSVLTLLSFYGIARAMLGFAPPYLSTRSLAVLVHVASVLPAIPLGAFLLLSRKGDARHKLLGKVWVALMVSTALSAIFIKTGGSFSWIHLFVPLTLWSSYKIVATARRRDFAAHRKEIIGTYLLALGIPGAVALFTPGRLMNHLIFG